MRMSQAKDLRGVYWDEGDKRFRGGGTLAVWPPQVPLWACVSATPRSAARDAASRGPVATPAPATLASGSARRAHTASVSLAVGVDGGGAGGLCQSPPDQPPPCPQTWTSVAVCPRPVPPGAVKTRQAASIACAARATERARGGRSAWVRNPPAQLQAPSCPRRPPAVPALPRFPTPLLPPPDRLPLSLPPHAASSARSRLFPSGPVPAVPRLLSGTRSGCAPPRPRPLHIPDWLPPSAGPNPALRQPQSIT